MLRSNYSFYPWKTLSLWCVTGLLLRNYCHPGLPVAANLFRWVRIVPLFLPARVTSFLTIEYTAWLPWIAYVYSRTSPLTLTTCHFVRLCKAFYIQFTKCRRYVDGVWFVRIRNTSGYQPDTSLPGSVFIVLEERLVVVAQNGWDVEFHSSITRSSILFLLTGTQSWRWKSSCPALQLLQTRW